MILIQTKMGKLGLNSQVTKKFILIVVWAKKMIQTLSEVKKAEYQ